MFQGTPTGKRCRLVIFFLHPFISSVPGPSTCPQYVLINTTERDEVTDQAGPGDREHDSWDGQRGSHSLAGMPSVWRADGSLPAAPRKKVFPGHPHKGRALLGRQIPTQRTLSHQPAEQGLSDRQAPHKHVHRKAWPVATRNAADTRLAGRGRRGRSWRWQRGERGPQPA